MSIIRANGLKRCAICIFLICVLFDLPQRLYLSLSRNYAQSRFLCESSSRSCDSISFVTALSKEMRHVPPSMYLG
ncbi:hypothetical protein BKA59DRAFT_540041, partial [Fusarium tricinctum]